MQWDPERQRAVGVSRTYYRDLLLSEDRNRPINAAEAERRWPKRLRRAAWKFLPATNLPPHGSHDWICFARRCPSTHGQRFAQQELAELLASAAKGKRSLEELRQLPLAPLLQGTLTYPLDRLFEQHAA